MPKSEKPYLNFLTDPELLKRIDDFRFQYRFLSRAAAINWLLDWALAQNPTPAKSAGAEPRKRRS